LRLPPEYHESDYLKCLENQAAPGDETAETYNKTCTDDSGTREANDDLAFR